MIKLQEGCWELQCSTTGDCDSYPPPLRRSSFQTLQQRRSIRGTRRDGVPGLCNGDPWRKTEQESSQGGADEAEAHQGGTEAHQGGADEAEAHQGGAGAAET